MKLIYIHQYYKTLDEPGPHRSAYLINDLLKAGWEVHVISSGNHKHQKKSTTNGLHVHYLPVSYDQKMDYFRRSLAFLHYMLLASFKAFSLGKADMLYATSTPLSVGMIAILLKVLRRQKYLFEVRDLWPGVPVEMGILRSGVLIKLLYWLEALIYKNAEAVVCLSPEISYNISKRYKNINTVVFTNMGDVEFHQRAWFDKKIDDILPIGHTIISYTGALGKANHLDFFLEAANASMKAQLPVFFVIAGEGSEKNRLIEKVKFKQLNNLVFTGQLSREENAYLLSRILFVYVSFAPYPLLWSGSPNKFFDALSAGKAVIINFSGWIRKIVEDERIGMYSDPSKPDEFVIMMKGVLKNPGLISKMHENALSLSKQKFSSKVVCSAWVDFVETRCLQKAKNEARRS